MGNFVLLFVCLFAGWLLRVGKRMPENGHLAINAVIIHLSLPALTLHTLHAFRFERSQLWPVLMPWGLFIVGASLFFLVGRRLGMSRSSIGALTLVGGLGNTSFVGLPIIESLQGKDGLGLGLLIDQLGSYLVLSTLGVFAAAYYASGERSSWRQIGRKVATFPPFIGLVLALATRGFPFPPVFDSVLLRLGDMLAPLALVSVGLQLRFGDIKMRRAALSLGLTYKLVLCPAMVVAMLMLFGTPHDSMSGVSVIEAAVPPMIGAAVVASQYKLDSVLVSTMVGLGIPLGLLTAAAWHSLYLSMA